MEGAGQWELPAPLRLPPALEGVRYGAQPPLVGHVGAPTPLRERRVKKVAELVPP